MSNLARYCLILFQSFTVSRVHSPHRLSYVHAIYPRHNCCGLPSYKLFLSIFI
nr:MAG TPA: hypothetical protein [Caudoviricetes sp.]